MIPKTIHYCWFGGNPKPEIIEKCIASWRKYCPDYEIIEWNETNYDINKTAFIKETYEAKMWAFVVDYARVDIVNTYGGVYLDTDVEINENLDRYLDYDAFFFFETARFLNLGMGFGAVTGTNALKSILEYYDSHHFNPKKIIASPGINTFSLLDCYPSLGVVHCK